MNEDDSNLPEEEIWKNYTKSIEPIKAKEKTTSIAKKQKINISRTEGEALFLAADAVKKEYRVGLKLGVMDGVDKNTARKLKGGKLPIDARLDLHGLDRLRAIGELQNFISGSCSRKYRCLLVVTGKGKGNVEGRAIIREAVVDFLQAPETRRFVLMFSEAAPKHGGSGAVYILLRKFS